MADLTQATDTSLNIVHVLRAPLGGLFRHVLDLCREQKRRGHRIGLIADSSTGGPNADRILSELEPDLALGLKRIPMRRNPRPADIAPMLTVDRFTRRVAAHVVHGHGSKGGVYARVPALWAGRDGPIRVYTPHGGSLHYSPGSLAHRFYMQAERAMAEATDLLLFESSYIGARFLDLVGTPRHLFKTVPNGIARAEFEPIRPAPDAADVLYVGELRTVKGIDTLLDALVVAGARLGRAPRALLVGTGAERDVLEGRVRQLGLTGTVSFAGSLPAREAFARGRILVVPSRAESLPYVVLEAAAAHVPMVSTHVGGIPEIFGPYKGRLIPPDDVAVLASRLVEMLTADDGALALETDDLARFVEARFSVEAMAEGILAGYREAIALRRSGRRAPALPRVPSYDRGTEP